MKKLTIVTLLLFTFVLVGCFARPGVNQNQNVNQNTNTNQAGEIDTSDWKTYRNEEYGFEFRYPGEWEIDIQEKGNVIKLWHPIRKDIDHSMYQADVRIGIINTDLSLPEWIIELDKESGGLDKNYSYKDGIYIYQRGHVDGYSKIIFRSNKKNVIITATFNGDILSSQANQSKSIAESFSLVE